MLTMLCVISIATYAQTTDVLTQNNTSCTITVTVWKTATSSCSATSTVIASFTLPPGGSTHFNPAGSQWVAQACYQSSDCQGVCVIASSGSSQDCTKMCSTNNDIASCGTCPIAQWTFAGVAGICTSTNGCGCIYGTLALNH